MTPSGDSLMSASSGAPGCGRLGTSAAKEGLDQGIAAAAAVNAMNSRRLHPPLGSFGGFWMTGGMGRPRSWRLSPRMHVLVLGVLAPNLFGLSLIHISEPTRLGMI